MEQVWFITGLADLLVAQDDLSIVRMHMPAGDQPPLHVHHDEEECFYVLSGEVTLWVGEMSPVVVRTGESAVAPRGIPHTYRAGDEPAVALVTTNGTFAAFVRAAGTDASEPGDPEKLARIAAEHRISLLGPPGMLPGEARRAAVSA
jgi:quercetin dioxygenase-like cupin family protein